MRTTFPPRGYILLALAFLPAGAHADKLGGSNLSAPPGLLHGPIHDDGPVFAVGVGTAAGFSTNAGPTLDKVASPFRETVFETALTRPTTVGLFSLVGAVSWREYTEAHEAREINGSIRGTLGASDTDGAWSTGFGVTRTRDVEEEITDVAFEVERKWSGNAISPFVRLETGLLDYRDVAGVFYEFANQDDRDRISSSGQAGFIVAAGGLVSLTFGAGIDHKLYLYKYDDFGLRRDSLSVFPVLGLAFGEGVLSFSATYTPLYRMFREALFPDRLTHAVAVNAAVTLSPAVKIYALARGGLEETDFLTASVAFERMALAGITVTAGGSVVTFEISRTDRGYDDLDLIELRRDDQKLEMALTVQSPISETVTMTATTRYLAYESSFGRAETEMLSVMGGVNYAFVK